jgi:hypothetical protein
LRGSNDKLILQRKLTTPTRSGGGYYLTGLIHCAGCGSRMKGRTQTIKGMTNVYYVCSGHHHRGNSFCQLNQIRQDAIMEDVIEQLEEMANDPQLAPKLEKHLRDVLDQISEASNVDELRRRKDENEKELATAERRLAVIDDDLFPIIHRQFKELQAEQKRLAAELAAAETPVESLLEAKRQKFTSAMATVSNVRQVMAHGDPCEVRAMLSGIIDRINVAVERQSSLGKKFHYVIAGGCIRMRDDFTTLVNVA